MKDFMTNCPEPLVAHYRVNAGYLPLEHWLHDPDQGGGRIIGEGCHFVDFLTFLVGESPTAVTAYALPECGRYREDNVVMTFSFPDGSLGTISYLANGDKSLPKERIEAFCAGRVAVLNDFRTLETISNGKRRTLRARLRHGTGKKWRSAERYSPKRQARRLQFSIQLELTMGFPHSLATRVTQTVNNNNTNPTASNRINRLTVL
jgi:predicted dehydrogenase